MAMREPTPEEEATLRLLRRTAIAGVAAFVAGQTTGWFAAKALGLSSKLSVLRWTDVAGVVLWSGSFVMFVSIGFRVWAFGRRSLFTPTSRTLAEVATGSALSIATVGWAWVQTSSEAAFSMGCGALAGLSLYGFILITRGSGLDALRDLLPSESRS
ncbi:MAG: hypothetical protein L0216_09060 [Planctomycetales bacterium]|nr:hypothetical protein [Planctomycetales bacterium]